MSDAKELEERLRARKAFGVIGNRWHMLPAPDTDCAEAADSLSLLRRQVEELEARCAESKIKLLCEMIVKAGGAIDASDSSYNLLNYFCDDAEPVDTFNQAVTRKLIHVTHDNRFDSSTAEITQAGRDLASSLSLQDERERAGDAK